LTLPNPSTASVCAPPPQDTSVGGTHTRLWEGSGRSLGATEKVILLREVSIPTTLTVQ
jgi:hypothetical protein